MEGIQTQLQNEVILWKLRLFRGICTEESRKHFYELLHQFTTLNGMLDSLIDGEVKYLEEVDQKLPKIEAAATEQLAEETETTRHQSRYKEAAVVNASELKRQKTQEKHLRRRKKFFSKIHERSVKLLTVVLNEVNECRSMIEITSAKAHDSVSLNCKMAQNRTENTSLCVLEESLKELTTTAWKKKINK